MCPRKTPETFETFDEDEFGPSRGDQKKSSDRLQALGERLAEMREDQLRKLPLDEVLLIALLELKRLRVHEAVRRQRQFVGKLMRHADEGRILEALNPLRNPALQRQLDLLLARLLMVGDEAVGEVTMRYPAAERHTVRQLVRLARKEADALPEQEYAEATHPARHKLWIYLRELAALSS